MKVISTVLVAIAALSSSLLIAPADPAYQTPVIGTDFDELMEAREGDMLSGLSQL